MLLFHTTKVISSVYKLVVCCNDIVENNYLKSIGSVYQSCDIEKKLKKLALFKKKLIYNAVDKFIQVDLIWFVLIQVCLMFVTR